MVAVGAALVGSNGAVIRTRRHRRHYGIAHPVPISVNGVRITRGHVRWVVTKVGIRSHFLRCCIGFNVTFNLRATNIHQIRPELT